MKNMVNRKGLTSEELKQKIYALQDNEYFYFKRATDEMGFVIQKVVFFWERYFMMGHIFDGWSVAYNLTDDYADTADVFSWLGGDLHQESEEEVFYIITKEEAETEGFLSELVLPEPVPAPKPARSISLGHLAEIIHGLDIKEEAYFKTSPDRDLYGIARFRQFDAEVLFVSYFNGHSMSILDVTSDEDVPMILEWLTDFFGKDRNYPVYPISRDELNKSLQK